MSTEPHVTIVVRHQTGEEYVVAGTRDTLEPAVDVYLLLEDENTLGDKRYLPVSIMWVDSEDTKKTGIVAAMRVNTGAHED